MRRLACSIRPGFGLPRTKLIAHPLQNRSRSGNRNLWRRRIAGHEQDASRRTLDQRGVANRSGRVPMKPNVRKMLERRRHQSHSKWTRRRRCKLHGSKTTWPRTTGEPAPIGRCAASALGSAASRLASFTSDQRNVSGAHDCPCLQVRRERRPASATAIAGVGKVVSPALQLRVSEGGRNCRVEPNCVGYKADQVLRRRVINWRSGFVIRQEALSCKFRSCSSASASCLAWITSFCRNFFNASAISSVRFRP